MGTEALWIPALISALGAGAGAVANKQAADRQEDIAANGMRAQQLKQREADDRINQEIGALEQSGPDEERRASLDGFLQQLRANAGAAGGSNVIGGSERFKQDTGAAKTAIANYGGRRADVLSRIKAPQLQRLGESQSADRTGSDVSGIARNANGEAFLNQLRYNSVQPNPWLTAAGQVAQGVAGGMASRAGSGGGFEDIPITAQRMPVSTMAGGSIANKFRTSAFG